MCHYTGAYGKTKLMPGRIMVILVTSGIVLGACGIYEPLVKYAGCGASVPLTGFGNVLWKGMKMSVDNSGFLGLFKGGFTACAVGVSAAMIAGYIASCVFEPKMKNRYKKSAVMDVTGSRLYFLIIVLIMFSCFFCTCG